MLRVGEVVPVDPGVAFGVRILSVTTMLTSATNAVHTTTPALFSRVMGLASSSGIIQLPTAL
jgi:hypothetical protein